MRPAAGCRCCWRKPTTWPRATSQWSTKLIHGGLRYLEYYEFRLVAEALAEREVLLANAPHIIEPLAFVLPHEPHLRPAWMIRIGLFLYDHIGGRITLPKSFSVNLAGSRWAAGLKPRFRKGFVYADARVDDARLVVVNALDAQARGADIRVRTRVTAARRDGALWRATLRAADGATSEVSARALVNAAGPWVKEMLDLVRPAKAGEGSVRHVKGSHIVVPRVHDEAHAYILQNADHRIVFVIPYQERYSLIGTTDIPVEAFEHPHISDEEIDYLLELANAYLAAPLTRADVVWTYSGVRPLYDDGATDPSAVTRDYVLKVDALEGAPGPDRAPVLSIFGGKITTYRKLAEHALSELAPYFPNLKPRLDQDGAAAGRRSSRAATATHGSRSCASAIRNCRRRCCKDWRDGTARARCASWATRRPCPISAPTSARASPRARSTTSSPRNGRTRPTTSSGAGRSAVCR